MRDLVAIDRQLAELGPELGTKQVAALLERLLGSDRSLERLNELLDGMGGTTPLPSARPSPLRDPLGVPGSRASSRPAALREGAQPSIRAPNPPGVRGSLPPRIVSPLAPVQGDSLKTATPWPPVASSIRSARDTLVDAAVPAPALVKVDEQELDAETAALFGITAPPAAMPPEAAAPASAAAAEPAGASAAVSSLPPPVAVTPAPAAEPADRGFSRTGRNTLQWAAGVDSPAPAEAPAAARPATEPPASEPPATRQSIRALLDQELDPREFPSSHPPRARSMPPPVPAQPSAAPGEGPDSFEMLIDDSEDDIMEIDDMELEEIE
jgi:nicotinate-nucleotide--dimethylbenzimidazole phosphoribosyltransferase